jgi:hypothetical protein
MAFRCLSVLLLIGAVGVTGCASGDSQSTHIVADPDVVALVDLDAVPTSYYVCHGYGCQEHSLIGLGKAEWQTVHSLFRRPAPNAIAERQRVASAIALFEQASGRKTGTESDSPKTPFSFFDKSQLDCVDESINTSTYLNMLQRFGMLRWHRPAVPVRRGNPLTFDIHFSGSLVELQSGERYVVDSWFFANGKKPAIIPVKIWQTGWHPDQAKQTIQQ